MASGLGWRVRSGGSWSPSGGLSQVVHGHRGHGLGDLSSCGGTDQVAHSPGAFDQLGGSLSGATGRWFMV